MTTVLLVIHFFIAAFMVGVILLQRSEGGALSGLGGGSGGLMSARGTANLLTRITGVLVAAFFMSSILIAIMLRSPENGQSILDKHERDLEKKEKQEISKPVDIKPVEEKLPEVPAPHTEGEVTPQALPVAPAAPAEPIKATEPAKGMDAVKAEEPNKAA